MNHSLRALLLSLVVLTFACKEDTPAPAPKPTLEGEWLMLDQTYYSYDASGNLLGKQVDTSDSIRLVFTATTFHSFDKHGVQNQPVTQYTFQSNRIHVPGRSAALDVPVTELTATRLTFEVQGAYLPGSTAAKVVGQEHYVRVK
ncbi:hypothetical protein F0P96_07840 [Hymenobacter busanensis]|uniref:Uncharacterized protein n=1 Tax=Hymenobacter busanensis TaxID=2607656 RepID=A0A7L5A004_9BACT|nr:hypothetical protein [Hymenobacter busanensis]KAA9338721.1 hypothetical protein F0P96_07840 [Hymenobacter busanensis]QHJ08848.1 hypothetical protein GUY19_16760 [Hymenobacter busanensis]